MFLDSVMHLMALLVLILIVMMVRRMIRLYRAQGALVPTAPAEQPDPDLSAARPVTPRKALPPTTHSASVLESYIDELLGNVEPTRPSAEAVVAAPQPAARLNVPLSRDPRSQPPAATDVQPEPAYQPIATILSKRCDLG